MHHVLILFAPLLVFFRFNHLIEQADLAVAPTLTIGKSAHAESQEKPAEEEKTSSQTADKTAVPAKETTAATAEEAVKQLHEGFDPLTLDENQVKVLQAMAEAQANKSSDAEVQKQKKLIELGEQKIAEQLSALQKIKTDVENTRCSLSKEEQANIIQTAKIYENMKPPAAADIFNKLERCV